MRILSLSVVLVGALAASSALASPVLIKVTPASASADDEGTVVKMRPGESSGRRALAAGAAPACEKAERKRAPGGLERRKS